MSAFVRYLPAAAELLPWLLNLATWMLARSLNMPEPLVHAAGLFVFVRVQAFENSFLKALCPKRLMRQILVVRFQHSHPSSAGTFANVGIKGPLENDDSSGALDLTFALRDRGQQGGERQIRSTSAVPSGAVIPNPNKETDMIESSPFLRRTCRHRVACPASSDRPRSQARKRR